MSGIDAFGRVRAAGLLRDYAKSGACGPLRAEECEQLAAALLESAKPEQCLPASAASTIARLLHDPMPLPIGHVYRPSSRPEVVPDGWLEMGRSYLRKDYPELAALFQNGAALDDPYMFELPSMPGCWIKAKP